jgi:hypothetical protein
MEASRVERGGAYLEPSRLSPGELVGMASGLVLVASLFMPWFTTSATNHNSVLAGASGGESVNAFDVFTTLQWLLVAAATAPFILSWIISRGHKLTWRPGEVTMVVGITAFVLILCNGIVLGRPHDSATDSAIDIGLAYGYVVALAASAGMIAAGYLRQAVYSDARKPPGVL